MDKLEKEIIEYSVISFDVFGTLVRRNVADAVTVFRLIEKRYDEIHGHGFGSQLYLIEAYGVKREAFHNTYIDWFMQGGIVHLLVNLAIFGNSFFTAYRLYISNL